MKGEKTIAEDIRIAHRNKGFIKGAEKVLSKGWLQGWRAVSKALLKKCRE